MNIEKTINEIKKIDWEEYDGPRFYKASDVPKYLCKLLSLTDEDEKDNSSIYNSLLSAVGNNHQGTYYKVVLSSLKYILETAVDGNSEVSRNCALNILIDLYFSFVPDAESISSKQESDELSLYVKNQIELARTKLYKNLSHESVRNKKLIIQLVNSMDI